MHLLVFCLPIDQDFEEACVLLRTCGAVHTSQQEVTVSDVGLEVLPFLQDLLQPFIDSYQVRRLLPPLTEKTYNPHDADMAAATTGVTTSALVLGFRGCLAAQK